MIIPTNIQTNKRIQFPEASAIQLINELTKEIKALPNDVLSVIQKLISLSPKHLAKYSLISKPIHRIIMDDNPLLKSFWHHHCVHRWGMSYVQNASKEKCKLSIYGRLYQIEKAAFRHLSLLDRAQGKIFEDDSDEDNANATIIIRYLQGTSHKAGWLYLMGRNTLGTDYLGALDYLKKAANKGSVDAAESLVYQYLTNPGLKNRFEHVIGYMLKAAGQNSESAKAALKLIQEDKWTEGVLTRLTVDERMACKAALNKALGVKVNDIV